MNDLIVFIASPKTEGIFLILKIIFIVIALAFFGSIIFLLLKNSWLKRRFLEDIIEIVTYRPFGVKKTFKQWAKISKRLEAKKEAEYKLAIIEADSLLNDILERMGYKGEMIGDRLKQLDSTILPNIEELWQAHKTRNNVVHDPDYSLTFDQAKKTVAIYEKALRDMEMF